jgi:UDP:flavonoid glycosyltransferase YjiC (YdhE family)
VRVLFTFVGGEGHLDPLVPIARAAAAAGHEVAVAGGRRLGPRIEEAGLTAIPVGAPGPPPERRPLLRPDLEREERDLRERFVRGATARVPELSALFEDRRPDVVVCDETAWAAGVAAEPLGIPVATVHVLASRSFVRPEVVAGPLAELRTAFGLPPDAPDPLLALSPFPPGFTGPLPPTVHPIRLRDAAPRVAGPLTVYFTLGTVFNLESGDLFTRALGGLRELPAEVVVTVGRGIDPGELGPQPANVRVETHVPQAELLPCCDLVVSHGGSGSLLGALAHGLPTVLIPMGADQIPNAARAAELGAARVLDAVDATSADVRDAAAAVLADPSYRSAAERLRDELATLPGPEHAVALLERLATERTAILPESLHGS